VDGHLVRTDKEPVEPSYATTVPLPFSGPSISIDNVPALRAYPSRSLEALGRRCRAKVIPGRPCLG